MNRLVSCDWIETISLLINQGNIYQWACHLSFQLVNNNIFLAFLFYVIASWLFTNALTHLTRPQQWVPYQKEWNHHVISFYWWYNNLLFTSVHHNCSQCHQTKALEICSYCWSRISNIMTASLTPRDSVYNITHHLWRVLKLHWPMMTNRLCLL